jgi:imidazolonepropionase-like amidohydrolase
MKKIIVLALTLLIFLNLFPQKTYIWCGVLVDGVATAPQNAMTIIVEKNMITAVEKGYTRGTSSDKIIDLKNNTVTPGWIDMHVHMSHETSPGRYTETFILGPADYAFRSVGYAEVTLQAGFTTVRDLGVSAKNEVGVVVALRNAINRGIIQGPRIYTAGKSIATTGGHADPTNGYRSDLMGSPGPEDGVVNGPDACREAVRQRYKESSDLIKITATGGVLSVAKSGSNPQFMEDEIRAIVQTANDYGFKVAVHAHGAEGMKRAIRAGVHSIEHGTYMDDEAIALFKQHGTWYVPTLTAGAAVADSAKKPGYYPDLVTPKALEIGPKIKSTLAKAYKQGVKIAFGTDAGVYKHGLNWLEFGYMMSAGMTGMDVIRAATVNAAELLGEPRLGGIVAGKWADIVAVDGDPLTDPHAFGKVVFIMKDGVVYKQSK